MGTNDVAGIGKLAEVLGRGLGALARPWLIRRELKAITESSDHLAEHGLMVRSAEVAGVKIELAEVVSAQDRRRADNIQAIAGEARAALPAAVEEGEVDDGWVSRFFGDAQDVSNERLQKLWGHVLAGKVAHPGSVSLRTLDVLRNLEADEAALFERVAGLAFDVFVIDPFAGMRSPTLRNVVRVDEQLLTEHYYATEFDPAAVRRLHDAGLLERELGAARVLRSASDERFDHTVRHAAGEVRIVGASPLAVLHVAATALTTAGQQLAPLVGRGGDPYVVEVLAHDLASKGFQVFLNGAPAGPK